MPVQYYIKYTYETEEATSETVSVDTSCPPVPVTLLQRRSAYLQNLSVGRHEVHLLVRRGYRRISPTIALQIIALLTCICPVSKNFVKKGAESLALPIKAIHLVAMRDLIPSSEMSVGAVVLLH